MSVTVNLSKLLDKEWEDKDLVEILAAPVSALAGLTPRHDEALAVLKVASIGDLGTNKYILAAVALAQLGKHSG